MRPRTFTANIDVKIFATRMHSSRMGTTRSLTAWGVSARGCLPRGGVYPGGHLPRRVSARGCHLTYPIMHLMLPVYCPYTNWDWSPVQLLIKCLVMWPVRHAGIPLPPVDRVTDTCKNITLSQTTFAGGNEESIHKLCFTFVEQENNAFSNFLKLRNVTRKVNERRWRFKNFKNRHILI